ncbi:tail protein X [Pseudomonas lactis]|uniref:tail protein X n=1 Tax=Pseudomonas lactis TaxID=1615674 RepID=UPI000AC59603|nr:tail protein X [Pseudomonas lactis]
MLLTHITTEGERWDQLAWQYYGDAHRYLPIVQANPHVPITAALPAGLILAIPLLEQVAVTEDLPPWMR